MPSPDEPVQPTGLDPAFGSYRPPVGDLEVAPVPDVPDAWYATYPDPGIQSILRAGATAMEIVFGTDDRGRVSNTRIEPFRWIAMLEITASDGSRWRGTGWLVSRYLMVTAGHCVYMPYRGGWISSIRVRFGANGDDNGNLTAEAAPPVTATDFRSVAGWVRDQNSDNDYGAILLPSPLPADYGSFSYEARSDSELGNQLFNVDGYPADKPLYTQWYFARFSAGVTPRTFTYTADTYGGDSGAPIYDYNGSRTALGIHTRGDLVSNDGIRITQDVVSNLTRWENEAARVVTQETVGDAQVPSSDIIRRLDGISETLQALATRVARLEATRSGEQAMEMSQQSAPSGTSASVNTTTPADADEPVSNRTARPDEVAKPAPRSRKVSGRSPERRRTNYNAKD